MIDENFEPQCKMCGDTYDERRFRLGILLCMSCGDELAKSRKFTVVPMHKSNYMMVTNQEDLVGINQKGGLVK